MFSARVTASTLSTKRLDADFYRPEFLETERALLRHSVSQLGDIGHFFAGPFGSLLPSSLYQASGVPLFRVGNVGQFEVLPDDFAYLAPDVHAELKTSEVLPGDLLVVKASVGEKICKVPDWIPRANITQHIIGIRPSGRFDTDYVSAFLYSKFGVSQLQRYSLGSIIQYLGISDAKSTYILNLGAHAQTYIGEKVRQVERLRNWAKSLSEAMSDEFAFLVANPLPSKLSWRASTFDLDSYRINPKQYDPVVLDLLDRARKSGTRLQPLGEIFNSRDLAGGATPKGAQYFSRGVLFARVQNVKPLRLDLSDAVYIDQDADDELARSRCAANDIIFSITGYPGTASLVTAEDLPVNINQHSVRFGIKEGVGAAYVCAALNSRFLKYQVDRLAIGGTRDALDYPSVCRLLIPRLAAETELAIDETARDYVAALKLAHRLTVAARALVEALIEGVIEEQQLVNAQQRLEAGDDQPDRGILARLKADGLDGNGPPLFADLDGLFDLLDQASQG